MYSRMSECGMCSREWGVPPEVSFKGPSGFEEPLGGQSGLDVRATVHSQMCIECLLYAGRCSSELKDEAAVTRSGRWQQTQRGGVGP